jgi:hypothetical protein
MGNNIVLTIVTSLITGVISSVLTYLGTRAKIRLELIAKYDEKLRTSRFEVYQELWTILKPLSKRRAPTITYQIIDDLSESIDTWYFDRGGIYLTDKGREVYFGLREVMREMLDERTEKNNGAEIRADRLAELLEKGSLLRTRLMQDAGTGREPFV